MASIPQTLSWVRIGVVVWASLWMLAAPLFHVHPEADHRHGEMGHVHGGTAHTVWSPDLDCEFTNHGNHAEAASGSAQFAHSGDGHTEFGLSLLTDSTDQKSIKPFVVQAFGFSSAIASEVEWYVRIQWDTASAPSPVLFVLPFSPRAPPSLLV